MTMRKFFAGILTGLLASTLLLMAEHRSSGKAVEPQVLADNAKVQMVRWVLQPGERTAVHRHDVDHIGVVIHGSTLRYVDQDGTSKTSEEPTGGAEYAPATRHAHWFENVGKTPFEAVSIDLKSPSGK
jgi:quercetin dioxygenase-like cupin family protein